MSEVGTSQEATAASPNVPNSQQMAEVQPPKANDDGPPTVLVTGASGYIATHIIQQLLTQGRFRVRGTVRSLANESKIQPLQRLVPDAKYPLTLVEADLEQADGWAEAVKGCPYVLHVASPFPSKIPRDENTVIQPAVNGTLNVLRACAEAGCVRRVVLTSSIAAVSSGMNGNGNPEQVYSEKDWSAEESCPPYEKSKLRAEKAAWNFVNGLEESKRFEFAVVNPGAVIGPLLTTTGGDTSIQSIMQLFTKSTGIPHVNWPTVDVRDVAAAHIAAMEKAEAVGNRCVLVGECIWYMDMANIVFREFFPLGYKTCTMGLPDFAMWFARLFNDGAKWLYPALGKHLQYNTERMREVLGIRPRPVKETIIDMCYSLIELGLVKKTPQYIQHQSGPPAAGAEPGAEGIPSTGPKKEEPLAAEAPKKEPLAAEEPKKEPSAAEEPKKEEPLAAEEPKKEEPLAAEEPKKEEPSAAEEPKKEEPSAAEEPKKEEPLAAEEPKKEPSAAEEPKKETEPKEEPANRND